MLREREIHYSPAKVEELVLDLYHVADGLSPSRRGLRKLLFNFDTCVVHEDEHLLVINKPPHVVAHVNSMYPVGVREIAKFVRGENLEIAHRLDVQTSGLMILTKHPGIYDAVSELLGNKEEHQAAKVYLAMLQGRLQVPPKYQVNAILRILDRNTEFVAFGELSVAQEGLRSSSTIYQSAEHFQRANSDYTLAKIQILTGRQHQIRVVSAQLGHPVVSDTLYGARRIDRVRTLLHAHKLEFEHPATRNRIVLEAEMPEDMVAFMKVNEGAQVRNVRRL